MFADTLFVGFDGLRVVSFESRRRDEMARLIRNYGGEPLVAPSMREVPLDGNVEAERFACALLAGDLDMVIFLTGVGARSLWRTITVRHSPARLTEALSRIIIAARGPKPAAALRELGIRVDVTTGEPHTWRELLAEFDARQLLREGLRVAIQEYGVSNEELVRELERRGALVRRIPVYQWAFPEDIAPLRQAVEAIIEGRVDVALFTSSAQVAHLLRFAAELGVEERLRAAFGRIAVASIGPVTSEALRECGLPSDMEPSRSKMGVLVREAAERSHDLLKEKRAIDRQ
ncbi:uroporphyrinogen-III synthase [Pyrinomonas methylaliphatogenes]|uniref:Uroporphyrinogen-III synthase n=1 Tax=Pyrinomonas methylaliphatogenes TaxID=454194 RepID=A0A0B6WY16_9BACT|nr:uroporphyrinogen-III synthase [Pyrinomonas methylaliphatogenes]CDM66158.1 uroporphyrinogen-III synthase [Pyrinomonas methylaliphatogenes]